MSDLFGNHIVGFPTRRLILHFLLQSETGTIQKGYNDLTELIADYIRKGDQNGLSGSLIHPIPVEGMQDEQDSGILLAAILVFILNFCRSNTSGCLY